MPAKATTTLGKVCIQTLGTQVIVLIQLQYNNKLKQDQALKQL